MRQLIKLFNKVGGRNVLKQYMKARVLMFVIFQTMSQGFSKKSLEIVRLSANNRVLCKLRRRYKSTAESFIRENTKQKNRSTRSNKVWVCWFQGIDNAPIIIKKCYQSLVDNMPDRDIIVLTEENYREYVNFPKHVQKRIDNGIITKTHMSDLLRLELLIQYGGTWIDATVFCSGNDIPNYMLDSDMFFYQILKPGRDGQASVMSSWFLTACTNNPILLLTREMIYEYWKKNNSMVDYFLLHDFFQIALEMYPEEWNKVIPRDSATPHILLLRLFEAYDDQIWQSAKEQSCFHKLTYKFGEEQAEITGTYYRKLFE